MDNLKYDYMIRFGWIKMGWNPLKYPIIKIAANSTMISSYRVALQRVQREAVVDEINTITFMLKDHVRVEGDECTDLWTEWSTKVNLLDFWDVYQKYYPPNDSLPDSYYKKFGYLYLLPYYQSHEPYKAIEQYGSMMLVHSNPMVEFLVTKSDYGRDIIQTWFDTDTTHGESELDKNIKEIKNMISKTRLDIERMKITLEFIRELIESKVGNMPYDMDLKELVEDIPYESQFDLWHYINNLKCTLTIPYCTYQSFHKFIDVPFVHEIPNRNDWVIDPNELAAYIELDGSYQLVRITPTHVMVSSNFVDQDSTPTVLLDRIKTAFGLPELISDPKNQKKIKAVYNVESPHINLHLFLYFITANDGYNECLFLDESRVLFDQPKRSRPYLYLFFYPDPRDKTIFVSFNLSNLRIRGSLEDEKDTIKTYIRIKVLRCRDQRVMDDMINFMTNVLFKYTANKSKIESDITTLFSKSKVELPVIDIPPLQKIKKGHERGLPFIPLEFTPDKVNGRQSEYYLVNPEQVRDEYKYEVGDNTMKFANGIDKPQAMVYPEKRMAYDTSPQKFYICRIPEHPFYKYSDIKYINNRKVPYCFKTNSALNPGSMILNQVDEKKPERTSYPKKTTQLLEVGQLGSVSTWLNRWTNMFHPDIVMERKSLCKRPEQSLLYVLESLLLKPKDSLENVTRTKHIELSKKLRENPGELYSYAKTNDIDPILEQFDKGYIDPMIFGPFLSRVYNINLFFAKKENMSRDVFFWTHVKPHSECYSLPEPAYGHFAMIILNKGAEFKNFSDPMCELIQIKDRLSDNTKLSLIPITHPLYTTLQNTITEMYGPKIIRGLPILDQRIVSQTINEKGFVSWLHTESISYAVMEPLCSLNLPVTQSVHLYTGALPHTNKTDMYKKWIGRYITRDGYNYFVPQQEHHNEKTKLYRWYEVSSRYLMEYTVYAFSKYAKDKDYKITDMNMNDIYTLMVEFAVDVFPPESFNPNVCDTIFTVSPDLSTSNTYYNSALNRITIPSTDIRKKLMYRLVHDINTNIEKVETYASEHTMRNFYISPLDFDELPHHHILKDTRIFMSYLAHPPHVKDGYVTIQPYAVQPYILFKSFAPFPAPRYIMQPVVSLSQATFLHNEWKAHRINRWRDEFITGDTVCHKIVWTSPNSTKIYQTDSADAPLCSFVNTPRGLFVHVMLPL